MSYPETRFRIDDRNRNDLLDNIARLAASYVPEWKFDTNHLNRTNPDPLSVIAVIFANQTEENIKRLNMVLHKYHIEFANMYEMARKPAIPARTICTLGVSGGIRPGVDIKKGTQVIGTTQDGEEVIFSFAHDISAVGAQLTDVIAASGHEKKVVAYSVEDGFPLFSYKGENIHRQALAMCFAGFRDIQEQDFRICFEGNFSSERLAEIFADQAHFTMSYISEDDLTAVVLEMTEPIEENIVLKNIELFAARQRVRPEFIWNGRSEAAGEIYAPFTQQPALYDEFFIGQDFLFAQQGTGLTLHFDLSFDRFLSGTAVGEDPDLRIVKRKPQNNLKRPHYISCVQEVTFEYFNGKGWKRLPADMDVSALFSKETNAGAYDVCFEAPADWESVVQGGYEGRCIRMQAVRADNCYMQEVEYIYPVLTGLSISMNEQSRGVFPQKIIKIQGREEEDITGAIAAGQEIPVFTQLEYAGDYVYLGFDRALGSGPVSMFVRLEKSLAFKGLELSFSYSARSGFKPLKVVDDTDSFQNPGRILFAPPSDMTACEVEGVERWWLRIEDCGRYFAVGQGEVPFVKEIHMNAVMVENIIEKEEQNYYIDVVTPNMRFSLYSDNILSVEVWVNEKEQLSGEEMKALMQDKTIRTKAEYNFLGEIEEFYILWNETDSFEHQVHRDLAAGAADHAKRCYCIDRGRSEIVFGDGVQVKVPLCVNDIAFKARVTCCDGEKANIPAGSIDRFRGTVLSVEEIRNPIDAYGGTNLEEMNDTLERGSNILSSRRRMVSERDYIQETLAFSDAVEQAACVTGLMKNGTRDDAVISMVLLMKDYQKGSYSFRSIQEPLKNYLMSCCEVTCGISDVQIVEPVFVKISMDIWLNVPDMSESLELKQQWIEKITNFLEPVRQNGSNGWRIGRLPGERQIRLMLGSFEDTAQIAQMNVTAQYTYHQREYITGLDRVEKNPFMVCCNGIHHVYINNTGR